MKDSGIKIYFLKCPVYWVNTRTKYLHSRHGTAVESRNIILSMESFQKLKFATRTAMAYLVENRLRVSNFSQYCLIF